MMVVKINHDEPSSNLVTNHVCLQNQHGESLNLILNQFLLLKNLVIEDHPWWHIGVPQRCNDAELLAESEEHRGGRWLIGVLGNHQGPGHGLELPWYQGCHGPWLVGGGC